MAKAKAKKKSAAPPVPVVGLDIGSRWIKAVEVKPTKAGPVITGIGYEATPQGAVVEDAILDSAAISAALKSLFTRSGISVRKVISSVAGQTAVVVRVIEVPQMKPEELADAMKWEVERHIPFATSEVVMDYRPLNRPSAVPGAANMEVLLAVVQEGVVQKHIDALMEAKLTPKAIEVEALALPRSVVHQNADVAEATVVAVADIGSETTKVCIYEQGILVFPRTVPIAGANFIRAISQALGIDETDAETKLQTEASVDLQLLNQMANPPEPEPEPPSMFQVEPDDHVALQDPFLASSQTQIPVGGPFGGPVGGPVGGPPASDEAEVPEASGFELGDDFLAPGPGGVFETDVEADEEPEAATVFSLDSPDTEDEAPRMGVFDLDDDEMPSSGPPIDLGGAGVEEPASSDFDQELADFQQIVNQEAQQVPAVVQHSPVAEAIGPVLMELAQELGRSLDYYAGRNPQPAEALVLCGGVARLPGLAAYLENTLGVKVVVGDPLVNRSIQSKRFAPEKLAEVAPAFAASLGLALRDFVGSDA